MKKILISLISVIFIISMITSVYAATGSINVGASNDKVKKGETFTVTIVATADSNIKGMQANFSYDTDKLLIENKAAGQGFFDASGSNEIAIGTTNSENLSQSGTLYTITFKVLDTASIGEAKISVTNAILALVEGQTDPSSDEVVINIVEDSGTPDEGTPDEGTPDEGNPDEGTPDDGKNPSNGDDNTGDGSDSNTGNKDSEENKNVNTNKDATKLPQTGAENASIIAIVVLAIISIASYISYKKYKNI